MRLWNKKLRSEQTCRTILLRNVRMESSKRTVRRLWEIWLDVSLWPHQEPSALSAAGDHHRDLDLVKMNRFWTFYHKNKQLESKSTHCIQSTKNLRCPAEKSPTEKWDHGQYFLNNQGKPRSTMVNRGSIFMMRFLDNISYRFASSNKSRSTLISIFVHFRRITGSKKSFRQSNRTSKNLEFWKPSVSAWLTSSSS